MKNKYSYLIGTDNEYLMYFNNVGRAKYNENTIEETSNTNVPSKLNESCENIKTKSKLKEDSNFSATDKLFKDEIVNIKGILNSISTDNDIMSKISSPKSLESALKNEYLTGSVYTKRTVKRGVGTGLAALAATGLGIAAYKNGGIGNLVSNVGNALTGKNVGDGATALAAGVGLVPPTGLPSTETSKTEDKVTPETSTTNNTPTPTKEVPKEKEITDELINEIWQNKHGKGEARKQKLRSMGYTEAQLDEIQRRVNAKDYRGSPKKVTQGVIDAVNRGEYGSGQARIQNLRGDGYTDAQIEYIQSVINKGVANNNTNTTSKVNNSNISQKIISEQYKNLLVDCYDTSIQSSIKNIPIRDLYTITYRLAYFPSSSYHYKNRTFYRNNLKKPTQAKKIIDEIHSNNRNK